MNLTYDTLINEYIDKIDEKKLNEAAIKGMMKYMKDEVYAATLAREFEISFSEIMPKIDAALAVVEEKLSR